MLCFNKKKFDLKLCILFMYINVGVCYIKNECNDMYVIFFIWNNYIEIDGVSVCMFLKL